MIDEVLQRELSAVLSAQLRVKIQINQSERIHGGDINETYRIQTNEGDMFLKLNNARRYPGMFAREYDGLQELRDKNVIAVPRPLGFGETAGKSYLVTEFMAKGAASPDFWENFAASVARLHQQTQPFFGYRDANYIGSIKQYNTPYNSWAVFYAFNRLLPLMRMAYDQQAITTADKEQIERLCKKLPELFPEEPPALLHGDLWSGNFMIGANGKACIFDPAVYYGHREMDLAMTRLFGGFDTRFYYTYQAIMPLAPGWQQRIGLCQLYPLLVHLVLFGGSYYNDIKEILQGF
ncbi:fructosamine kinase family protein [Chitinophaga horti]|uniref:Fructosamine kinase family protein n=1 Tax=Chitinophaga horti TaxID=2920382 RepID=A0ABY6J3K0_9BACT|nr:fructosamine kinase family protein [Chitinophaga horti]UYQ94212.1 fructosamine kinase family protein [Chitinophaga horti]